MSPYMTIYDFSERKNAEGWRIINDGVMGGLSKGQILQQDNSGIFKGKVSTENNGGFTMTMLELDQRDVRQYTRFKLKIKGDGKSYQFRCKSDKNQMHSYVYEFNTSGDWEEVTIPFEQMMPKFRGRDLNQPVYQGQYLEEIAFLIGNKKEENFQLMIKYIRVE
jgi:hypothetical protein